MRVFLVNNLYKPYSRGGAETTVESTARTMRDAGHDVHVVTLGRSSDVHWFWRTRTTAEDGITVHRYAPMQWFNYVNNIGRMPMWLRVLWHAWDAIEDFGYWVLRRRIRQLQPDHVYTHNVKGMGMMILRAGRFAAAHTHVLHDVQLLTPSGLMWHGQENHWTVTGTLAAIYRRVTKSYTQHIRTVEGPTQWIIDTHRFFGLFEHARAVKTVQTLPVAPAREVPRREGGKKIFLYVGQIEVHKGVEFLIRAWREYSAQYPESQLHIAGEGALLPVIHLQSQGQKITVHGRLSHDDLGRLYRDADALVVPSLCYENAPTVIHEAHAHGLHVIASRIGGIPELVVQSDRLFEPQNQQELIECLEST